ELLKGVLQSMLLTKLKSAGALLLAFAFLGAATIALACRLGAGEPATPRVSGEQGGKAGPVAVEEKPDPNREELRYGGKPFHAWRQLLRTELKPQIRAEAIKALGAFGINGFGVEATTAILQAAKSYPEPVDLEELKVLEAAEEMLARIGLKA